MSPHEQVIAKLNAAGVPFETAHHEPTRTSEDASRIRGVEMHSGAKALVVRGHKTGAHYLCVIPADLKLDSKAVKTVFGEPVGFASDLEAVTGCVPGSMPPFGSIFGLRTVVDPRLGDNETINFNAGSLTDSVRMRYDDWRNVEHPEVALIAK